MVVQHTPSAQELETAIVGVMNESEAPMTPKEVRQKLMKDKGAWKVPAERRIAKFVKRQNSRKAKENGGGGGKSGMFARFFKGSGNSNHNGSSQPQTSAASDPPPPESHPASNINSDSVVVGSTSQGEQKPWNKASVSVLTALTPKAKSKTTNERAVVPSTPANTTLFRKSSTASERSLISYEQAEAERSMISQDVVKKEAAAPTVATVEVDSVPKDVPTSVDKKDANAVADVKVEGDGVEVTAGSEGEEHVKPDPPTQKKVADAYSDDNSPMQKEVADAYADDNDGKTRGCECEGCIIL